jgi:hypothetical protein
MAALSHGIGVRLKVTNGSHKNKFGKVAVQNGHKVIVLDKRAGEKDSTVLYGANDSMVERA